MKKGIHPKYRPVVFKDMSIDHSFLTKSTVDTKETIVWEDGKEYLTHSLPGNKKFLILLVWLRNSTDDTVKRPSKYFIKAALCSFSFYCPPTYLTKILSKRLFLVFSFIDK